MDSKISIKKFELLSNIDIYRILKARLQIFVVEQNCPYQDIDNVDYDALHVTVYQGRACTDNLFAYCRIIVPTVSDSGQPEIGRVLVLPEHRGIGLSRQMMIYAIEYCHSTYPHQYIHISAQTYLIDFYESLGFKVSGQPYLEDDITHITMILYQI